MGFVKFIVIFALWISLLFSSYSVANSAACILLKHDMNAYKHSKNHPIYRRAKRDYDRMCNQPEQPQSSSQNAATQNTAQQNASSQNNVAKKQAELGKTEPQTTTAASTENIDVNKLAEIPSNQNEQQTLDGTATVQATEPLKKSEPENQSKKHTQSRSKPVPMQWQSQPVQSTGLLEAMRVPLFMTLAALIAMFIYVRYVRSRIEEFKDKAQIVKNDLSSIGSQLAKKKKAKPAKNSLDPDLYFRRQRVELTLANGKEIQLENVILSQYGIFVVLPQKQRGAIIGSATLPEWKEQSGENIVVFDSPLQIVNQCCHSIGQTIEVGIEIEPIVAFSDMAVFKSQFPIAVMHQKQVNEYILGFKELRYSDQQVEQWLVKLDDFITQYRDAKKAKEEQLVEQNRQRNVAEQSSQAPLLAEQAEQELLQQQKSTVYPEPGSYESPIDSSDGKGHSNIDSSIVNDTDVGISSDMNSDTDREDTSSSSSQETDEKTIVDPLAELDAILNRAKQFTNKLDEINNETGTSGLPSSASDESTVTEFNSQHVEQHDENSLSSTVSENSPGKNPIQEDLSVISSLDKKHTVSAEVTLNNEAPIPSNMIPHSEFKRRAAKKAVDDGMFDYLEHYTDKSGKSQTNNELNFEQELEQSLEAGKGFLSELDNSLENEPTSATTEGSELQGENSSAEATMNTFDNSEFTLSELPEGDTKNIESGIIEPIITSEKTQASVTENEATIHDDKASESQQSSANESGWRALKQEIEEHNSPKEKVSSQSDEQNDQNKSDEENKPSPFANLELDPEWAPKPPPKKIYKTNPEDDPDNN